LADLIERCLPGGIKAPDEALVAFAGLGRRVSTFLNFDQFGKRWA
jgi:hypothetical protein